MKAVHAQYGADLGDHVMFEVGESAYFRSYGLSSFETVA